MFEGAFQPLHWLLVFGIIMILFGPGKLPEIGKGLGESIRNFREALAGPDGKQALPPTSGNDGTHPTD